MSQTENSHQANEPHGPTGDEELPESNVLLGLDSDETPTVSVVLPTLNEEQGIAECIQWITESLRELGINGEIIVSDSSTDRTPEIARSMGANVVEPDEPGYGYAYRFAFRHARGEYVVIGDADTTYDFRELPALYERIQRPDVDMVLGSRFEGEIRPNAMPPLHQYVGNPLLTKFLNVFYGAEVSDAHSGFRIVTREALDRLCLQTDGMEFASEMIMEAAASDLTIEEVPITYRERKGEATLDSFEDGWRHVKFMLLHAPGYLFSVPGIAFFSLGLVITAFAYSGVPIAGLGISPGANSLIAGGLFVVLGVQLTSFGVFAAAATDPIRDPTDPVTVWLVERLDLVHGMTVGAVLTGLGLGYAAYLFAGWIQSGYAALPGISQGLGAFLCVVVGAQIVFSSFLYTVLTGDDVPRKRH